MSGETWPARWRAKLQLAIPISPHVQADLTLPFPMSEADWQQLMVVLEAMKPGLVRVKVTSGE